MHRFYKPIQALIILIFLLSLIGPATATPSSPPARLHPLLARLAAESPDQMVSVIVQKTVASDRVERLVAELGGVVTKDLHIINAFAARVPASATPRLARLAAVSWVSLDAPVKSASATTETVRDEFNAASFGNNDGTLSWAGDWLEYDVYGAGPDHGNVQINSGALRLDDRPNTGTQPSAARGVDLSNGVITATLSFDFQTGSGVEAGEDRIAIEVSADGGASYTTLEVMDAFDGTVSGSRSYDITAYISDSTMVRFKVLERYGGWNEYFLADNIQIEFVVESAPAPLFNTYLETIEADSLHNQGITGQGITVAVVDSGIGSHLDLYGRLAGAPLGADDLYGHGTHVSGIIGGSGQLSAGLYKGVAPGVDFISLKVADTTGMALESDVVDALQWVHDYDTQFNIRVVNLSLNTTVEDSYHTSPMNAAAEILWFNGIVVVASSGNKGPGGGHNTAKTAPANDPFIITVGASDEHGTADTSDDTVAPFSSFGTTVDGFHKPDIIAPGYNIIGALSDDSPWDQEHPDRLVLGDLYIRLSGTSMAAPMVTGAVALLLQDEPNLTPDQVKYRLLNTGTTIQGDGYTYPYLDAYAAVTGTSTESANTGIDASQLLWTGSDPVTWDSVSWNSVSWNSVSWNSVSWNSVSWNSVYLDGIFWGRGRGH